jgi:DNA modification methylase
MTSNLQTSIEPAGTPPVQCSVLLAGQFVTVKNGDCRTVLKSMPPESVNCIVTSPPFWGLRDYGHPDQLGQEATPGEYVEALRAVFAEARRVLRADGTLWLNLGDSYAGSWGNYVAPGSTSAKAMDKRRKDRYGTFKSPMADRSGKSGNKGNKSANGNQAHRFGDGLPPGKNLIGIPWRVAFALQADGWYLRSDIIWNKPNPMPESVADRPTKSHEYIFLFAKSADYYYDAAAIAEPTVCDRMRGPALHGDLVSTNGNDGLSRRPIGETRNKRTVWTVNTESYRGAHFATYPTELIRPCILAGCPLNGIVLDPFGGSGTTGKVALEAGRRAYIIELNPEYTKLCNERCTTTRGLPLAC